MNLTEIVAGVKDLFPGADRQAMQVVAELVHKGARDELATILQREAATTASYDARIAGLEAKLETVTAARDALLDDKQIVKDLYDLVVIQRDTFLVRAEQAESRVAVLEAMVAAKGGEA